MFFSQCSKVFHVRPVTQGDVIRADAKEIPRIFQLLYAGEGEARRPDDPNIEMNTLKNVVDERIGITTFKGENSMEFEYNEFTISRQSCSRQQLLLLFKILFHEFHCVILGHEFVPLNYHMPTACEVCPRPLWHVFKPPAAYECKR